MHLYVFLLLVLGICFGNGYPIAESESGSALGQNSESIDKPLQDIEASDYESTDEEDEQWMRDVEDRFTGSLLRMLDGTDDLYKDEKFDSVLKTLKGMEIDEDYVKRFVETLRKQDLAKRRQFDEVMANKLDFSTSDLRDLLDKFAKEIKSSPAASKSV